MSSMCDALTMSGCPDPATTASEATTSVVVAPAASQVAESTPPTVATSIAQPSAPIVATILNRYLAKSSASSNTPSSSSSSLAATSSQSVPGPSTLASVPLPALSSAEAIGGWRKQQLDRKKLADTNTQASRTKGKAKVKGKEVCIGAIVSVPAHPYAAREGPQNRMARCVCRWPRGRSCPSDSTWYSMFLSGILPTPACQSQPSSTM